MHLRINIGNSNTSNGTSNCIVCHTTKYDTHVSCATIPQNCKTTAVNFDESYSIHHHKLISVKLQWPNGQIYKFIATVLSTQISQGNDGIGNSKMINHNILYLSDISQMVMWGG